MQKALVYHNGDLIKTYEFNQSTISIGRLPVNDISINSMSVSRTHLQLQYSPQAQGFIALESKSLNGTLLNGALVETNMSIPSGSVLVIGHYSIHFEYTQEAIEPATKNLASHHEEAEQTGTITLPKGSATQTQQIPAAPSPNTQDGLYFGGKSSNATATSKAIATLVDQATLMEYPISKKDITFGNSPNDDIFIEEGKLAKIVVNGSICEIKALKVMGKIVVNGTKVGQQILNNGDTIKVGKSSFTFKSA